VSRRGALSAAAALALLAPASARGSDAPASSARAYVQRYPTLFAPFIGADERETRLVAIVPGEVWALEQNLAIGPLETPLRCVVVKLANGDLWVHAPLAPTREFFELVESLSDRPPAHVVVPTYALEHKIFARDALERWPRAQLWVAPGQFSFPIEVPLRRVFGREPDGILRGMGGSDEDDEDDEDDGDDAGLGGRTRDPPWLDEIRCDVLRAGRFAVGGRDVAIREAVFFHASSKTLIVTDALARIPSAIPPLQTPEKLLLVGKRSTADPMPADTPENRSAGWRKMALLVTYFFPEHEELARDRPGTVEWTPGWEDNFAFLSDRLLVPPVVRSLLYAQDPGRVRAFVDRVCGSNAWDFERVVPAHWDAPVAADPEAVRAAFRFLDDPGADAFPEGDMARGLQPIIDAVVAKK
jgi:hypothetical protein